MDMFIISELLAWCNRIKGVEVKFANKSAYFSCMQLKLPIFPATATLISDCLGVYEKEGLIQYIVNGLPVYAHAKGDLKAFGISPVILFISNFAERPMCSGVFILVKAVLNVPIINSLNKGRPVFLGSTQ